MERLKVELTNEFKIIPNKILKINENYYVGARDSLFEGKTVKQIQYILFTLCLADNMIQFKRNSEENSNYMPDFVELTIKREDYRVFRFLYGVHIKDFIDMDKNFDMEHIYTSKVLDDESVNISVNTDIFKYNENKNYTNVWIGDILLTKKKSSIYLKMKMYSFLKVKDYIEGFGAISDDSNITVILSKSSFSEWCLCGNRYSQFIIDMMKSINKENEFEIIGNYSIKNAIIFTFNEKSVANHIKQNGIIAHNKYFGKTKTKVINRTW